MLLKAGEDYSYHLLTPRAAVSRSTVHCPPFQLFLGGGGLFGEGMTIQL